MTPSRFATRDHEAIYLQLLGLSILYLIRQSEREAPGRARELVARTKLEIQQEALRDDLLELIETVILYKLPRLKREEIQAMLEIHDIRQSRVYQEAKEEGREEGIEEERQRQLQDKVRAVAKLAALRISADEIAEILALDVNLVRQEMAKKQS